MFGWGAQGRGWMVVRCGAPESTRCGSACRASLVGVNVPVADLIAEQSVLSEARAGKEQRGRATERKKTLQGTRKKEKKNSVIVLVGGEGFWSRACKC